MKTRNVPGWAEVSAAKSGQQVAGVRVLRRRRRRPQGAPRHGRLCALRARRCCRRAARGRRRPEPAAPAAPRLQTRALSALPRPLHSPPRRADNSSGSSGDGRRATAVLRAARGAEGAPRRVVGDVRCREAPPSVPGRPPPRGSARRPPRPPAEAGSGSGCWLRLAPAPAPARALSTGSAPARSPAGARAKRCGVHEAAMQSMA